ncbi:MAG: Lrp/AsnC family transcriptional regulator [Chloroflexi bacterium]|nr:Lrp/AsnC family transcriptional regulator [Chloroflexota bacterium]
MSDSIDAVDLKLIGVLSRNARLPYTVIAEKIGVNPVTTKKRVRRLLREGIITLEMVPDPARLGYQTVALIGLHTRLARSEQVAKDLVAKSAVVYVALTSGRYDILAFALFKSPLTLAEFVENELAGIEGIEWTETLMNLKVIRQPWATVLEPAPTSREIDALDRRIIEGLQDDIRIPFAGLATKLGISVPTVRQRVGRLVNEGILAFCALPDIVKLGYQTIATLGLGVRLSKIKEVQRELLNKKNLQYIGLTAGRYDLVVWGLFQSPTDLTTFLQKELAPIEGIERSETFLNLQVLKRSFKDVISAF